MKYIFLILLIFLIFSCNNTPETVEPVEELFDITEAEELITETQIEEIEEQIEIEETEEKLIVDIEEIEEIDEIIEIAESEIEDEIEEADIITEETVQQEEEIIEVVEADLEEEEIIAEETEQIIEEEEPATLAEEVPVIVPQPVIEPEPEATPETAGQPAPEPQPAPEQPVRRPPVSTALLGPAEERVVPPPPLQQRPQVQQRPNITETPRTQQPVREMPNIVVTPQERQEEGRVPSPSISDSELQPIVITEVPQNPQREETNISRSIRAVVGQTIEVPFRGTNWVYLGELASRRGISYSSRRLDTEGQSFIFRAEEPGTYVLNFSRQDYVRGFVINDHVQVIVSEPSDAGAGWFRQGDERGRVIAQPRWPSALEEAEILSGARTPDTLTRLRDTQSAASTEVPRSSSATHSEASGIVTQIPPPASAALTSSDSIPFSIMEDTGDGGIVQRPEFLPPDTLLQRARESFDAGNVTAAIAHLDQFRINYPGLSEDELFWLYGQFYEANSPSRDILLSLDYYRRLVREYPQSVRLTDARRRIAYLERFYINIQ